MNFDVHANSKHYHPKDSEYVAEDMFAKPGKGFYGNQQAVKMNVGAPQKPDEFEHPLEAQVMQNRLRQQMGYPMAGPPAPGPNYWDNTTMNLPKYPMPQVNDLQFNPQIANTQYQKDASLQKNIAMIGGITPVIPGMERSLMDNEMRFIGMNKNQSSSTNSLLGHAETGGPGQFLGGNQMGSQMGNQMGSHMGSQMRGQPGMGLGGNHMGLGGGPNMMQMHNPDYGQARMNDMYSGNPGGGFLQTEYLPNPNSHNLESQIENPQFAHELEKTRQMRMKQESELKKMRKTHDKMSAYGDILKKSVDHKEFKH